MVIGRDKDKCNYCFEDDVLLADIHGMFEKDEDGKWYYMNLDSKIGTYLVMERDDKFSNEIRLKNNTVIKFSSNFFHNKGKLEYKV